MPDRRWTGTSAPGWALRNGNGTGSGEVFELLRASGYLDLVMEQSLQPVMTDVTRTFTAAYGRPSPVVRSIVARENGALIGHVSAIGVYDRTWMVQHLATLPTRHVADTLSIASSDDLLRHTDIEFFRIWYQSHKSWPSRVFGGFVRSVADPARSDLRAFRLATLDATETSSEEDPADGSRGIEVVPADDGDLALVARHLGERLPPLLVEADDLDARGLSLDALGRRFASIGLERRRQILMATRHGVRLGFALAELSSVGLNLHELLSTFRLFVLPPGEGVAPIVRRALSRGIARLYRSAGRTRPRGLLPLEEVAACEGTGIAPGEKTWMCCTFAKDLYPAFRAHLEGLFGKVRRARERARPMTDEPAGDRLRAVTGFQNVDATAESGALVKYLDTVTATTTARDYKRRALAALQLAPRHRALDVGCGTGEDVRAMAAVVGRQGRVVGVDLSRTLVTEARKRTPADPALPAVFQLGDAHALPFASGCFDAVRADRVFQHLADPRRAFAEMVRVTRPGGTVLVADPDWQTLVIAGGGDDRAAARAVVDFHCDRTRNGWMGRELVSLFRDAGLADIKVSPETVIMTDLALADAVFELRASARAAARSRRLSDSQARGFVEALDASASPGHFLASVTGFVVVARVAIPTAQGEPARGIEVG